MPESEVSLWFKALRLEGLLLSKRPALHPTPRQRPLCLLFLSPGSCSPRSFHGGPVLTVQALAPMSSQLPHLSAQILPIILVSTSSPAFTFSAFIIICNHPIHCCYYIFSYLLCAPVRHQECKFREDKNLFSLVVEWWLVSVH